MLIFDFSPDSYRDKISDFTPGCEATGKQAFKKRRTRVGPLTERRNESLIKAQ